MVHTQARVFSANPDRALAGLTTMLSARAQREEAFDIALKIALADLRVGLAEREMLTRIRTILDLHGGDLNA